MVTSKQDIDIPHPIYDTADKAFFSPCVVSCRKLRIYLSYSVSISYYRTDLVTTRHIHYYSKTCQMSTTAINGRIL